MLLPDELTPKYETMAQSPINTTICYTLLIYFIDNFVRNLVISTVSVPLAQFWKNWANSSDFALHQRPNQIYSRAWHQAKSDDLTKFSYPYCFTCCQTHMTSSKTTQVGKLGQIIWFCLTSSPGIYTISLLQSKIRWVGPIFSSWAKGTDAMWSS